MLSIDQKIKICKKLNFIPYFRVKRKELYERKASIILGALVPKLLEISDYATNKVKEKINNGEITGEDKIYYEWKMRELEKLKPTLFRFQGNTPDENKN